MSVSHGTETGAMPSRVRWSNILPIVFVMYTIAYFDRANIGIALPYITQDLNLTSSQAGFIGGVFAWGYSATQIFAAFLILKLGARRVIGFTLVVWGFAAVGTAFVHSFEQLVAMRILLGLFEGPVFAATAALLAEWFVKSERARAFGIWNLSSPIGAFLAGPISGFILAHYDWRVMMIVEGTPAWIWAVLWWWRIPKSVEHAKWLPADERNAVKDQLAAEQAAFGATDKSSWRSVLTEPTVWLTLLGFTMVNFLINGYMLWLPSILKSYELSIVSVGWLSGAPFLLGAAGIFLVTLSSDRFGQERRWHAAVPTVLTGVLVLMVMFVPDDQPWIKIGLLVLAGFPMKMFLPLVFTRLTEILARPKAVTATVIVNTTAGFIAGFGGPYVIGFLKQHTGNYEIAFGFLGAAGVLAGIFFALIRRKKT